MKVEILFKGQEPIKFERACSLESLPEQDGMQRIKITWMEYSHDGFRGGDREKHTIYTFPPESLVCIKEE